MTLCFPPTHLAAPAQDCFWHSTDPVASPATWPLIGVNPTGNDLSKLNLYRFQLGETFRVEVDGELKPTRMEFAHGKRGGGSYYSVDGYDLRSGLRAAVGE